jgi:hypothetical protein
MGPEPQLRPVRRMALTLDLGPPAFDPVHEERSEQHDRDGKSRVDEPLDWGSAPS